MFFCLFFPELAVSLQWFSLSSFCLCSVFPAAAIIFCCKADRRMSSNGDLSDLGSSDSFWEVENTHNVSLYDFDKRKHDWLNQ